MTGLLERTGISPAISVVICAYTEARFELLAAAVDSVETQSAPVDQLVIVIDHCEPLLRRAREHFAGALVIENTEQKGLSGARNSGVEASRGEIVAFLDDDAAAAPDWIEQLLQKYSDPSVAGVGGLVVPAWTAGRPGWFPPEFDWVVGCSHAGMPRSTEAVRNFVGANMSFRRSVLLGVGGFAGELGRVGADAAGCEETELCIRAQGAGSRSLVYEPSALVRHTVPKERGTLSYFTRRCLAEGRSKAVVSERVGARSGLDCERVYLARTLPHGAFEAVVDLVHRRPAAARRGLVLVVGALLTTYGYLRYRIRRAASVLPKLSIAGLGLAAVLLGLALTSPIALSKMNDLGLVVVLPLTYWAAVALVTASFAYTLARHPERRGLLIAHTILVLVAFHATPALLYPTLRYPWAWKHVAITNGIVSSHGVSLSAGPSSLVAYQDWPGFFSLAAMVSNATGVGSAMRWAALGPLLNELSYAGPLLMIFRFFSADKRVQWGALWIFYLGNWIGQDYFSPQGFDFFLYLVVIAIALRFLSSYRARSVGLRVPKEPSVTERRGYYLVLVVLFVAIVSSHQLTPYMLVSSLVVLAVVRRLRHPSLALLSATCAVAWTLSAGWSFLKENPSIYASIGNLLSNTSVQMIGASASADQLLISKIDRLVVVSIGVLALVGLVRNARSSRRADLVPVVALIFSSGVALAGNSYGGEIVFRVYLFALPFLALLGAMAFASRRDASERFRTSIVRAAVLALLLGGFLISYYGKDLVYYFPPSEVSAAEHFYSSIPNGSFIVGIADNSPFPLKRYSEFTYYYVTEDTPSAIKAFNAKPLGALENDLSGVTHSYVMFTRSDEQDISMTGGLPRGEYARVEALVAASPAFHRVLDRSGVIVYEPTSQFTQDKTAGAAVTASLRGAAAGSDPARAAPAQAVLGSVR